MALELAREEREWSLTLSGVIDVFDAQALHAAAVEASTTAPAVVVRLAAVESFDTSTTQILLALRRALAVDGRALRLEGTPPGVAELWRVTGLETDLG